LRIAEEANLRGISYKTTRSKICQFQCYGYLFVVEANNTEYAQGFCVTVCSVQHGNDYTNLPQNAGQYNVPLEKYYSPFKTAMVVPLILGMITDNPGCTNKTLRGFLKGYGSKYAFTEKCSTNAIVWISWNKRDICQNSQGRIAETWPHCSIELHGETGDAEKDQGCGIVGRIAS
jgi:hypothetical protein